MEKFRCLNACAYVYTWPVLGRRIADDERFMLESAVRGHHVFKMTWTPWTGQMLQVCTEAGNAQDRYTVATLLDNVIVGHAPREFLRIVWHLLQHGGRITCESTSLPTNYL